MIYMGTAARLDSSCRRIRRAAKDEENEGGVTALSSRGDGTTAAEAVVRLIVCCVGLGLLCA